MWRKEDATPQAPEAQARPGVPANVSKPAPGPVSSTSSGKVPACISQGIKIKGDVTGTEDLFIDGVIEGQINLGNASVTVGPNGTVRAEITAREVVLRGVAEGKFTAEERIQIWHTARVHGELKSERISIEDGAELRGKVEAGNAAPKMAQMEAAPRGKKAEHSKPAETSPKDANIKPGAATAGAD
jgi:cytoskeletal protein CcmA (bactofilin family)